MGELQTKSRTWCVYVHVNKINGKKYVGQTCQQPEKRWNYGHGYIESPRFYNAIKKYGWNNFDHIIVKDNLTLIEANTLEENLIKEFNTTSDKYGYNLQSGGLNKLHSEETKKKISESNFGKHISDESKKKMSEARRGIYVGEKNPKSHPVVQLTKDDVFVRYWGCIKDAAECIGVNEACIRGCLTGRQKVSGGYKWIDKEVYEKNEKQKTAFCSRE